MTRYHLDAYGALEGGRDSMASFFRSSFQMADGRLDEAVHDTISRFGILAPPVVEATFPYKEAVELPRTVEQLGELAQGVPRVDGHTAVAAGAVSVGRRRAFGAPSVPL